LNKNNSLDKGRNWKNNNCVSSFTNNFGEILLTCLKNRNWVWKEVNKTRKLINQCVNNWNHNIELAKKLTNKIKNLIEPFLGQNGDCNVENILNLLSTINNIFINNEDIIDMFHISLFMNRLPKISNKQYIIKLAREKNQSLENIMKIIYSKFSSEEYKLDAQSLWNIMYGFQVYDKDKYNILDILAKKIPEVKLDAQSVWTALYGLQNLRDVPNELLEEFAKKIPEIKLDAQSIWNALYGLHNMKDLAKSKELINILFWKLNDFKNTFNAINIVYSKQIFSYYNLPTPSWLEEKFLANKESFVNSPNDIEKGVFEHTKKMLSWEDIYLSHFIDDWFELDIYIPSLKTNIEIDSKYHDNCKSRDEKRDEHLKSRFWLNILRIDNRVWFDEIIKFCTFEINKILNLSTI